MLTRLPGRDTRSAAIARRARRLLLAGCALATLAGAGLSSACARGGGEARADGAPGAATAPADPRSPERERAGRVEPTSGENLLRKVRASGARAVLVNMWGTWCMPCREEFPDLVRLKRDYENRGLEVILVSIDFDSEMPQVWRFLEEQGVDFPTYIKTGKDMEFINGFESRWSGALPATFLYGAGGRLRHMWEEKGSYVKFEQKVLELLEKPAVGAATEDGS